MAVLTVLAVPDDYEQFWSSKAFGPVEDFHQSGTSGPIVPDGHGYIGPNLQDMYNVYHQAAESAVKKTFSSSHKHKNYNPETFDYEDDSNDASASSGAYNYRASYDSKGMYNNNKGLTNTKGLILEDENDHDKIFENDYEYVDQTARDDQKASARGGGYGHKGYHNVHHNHKGKHNHHHYHHHYHHKGKGHDHGYHWSGEQEIYFIRTTAELNWFLERQINLNTS